MTVPCPDCGEPMTSESCGQNHDTASCSSCGFCDRCLVAY